MKNAEREWRSVVPVSVLADKLERTSWRVAEGKVDSAHAPDSGTLSGCIRHARTFDSI